MTQILNDLKKINERLKKILNEMDKKMDDKRLLELHDQNHELYNRLKLNEDLLICEMKLNKSLKNQISYYQDLIKQLQDRIDKLFSLSFKENPLRFPSINEMNIDDSN